MHSFVASPRTLALPFLLLIAVQGACAQGVTTFSLQQQESTGETELTALAMAYPDRIVGLAQRNGEWSVEVDGAWFAWAHGRMLPERARDSWRSWAAYRFYRYSIGPLPPLPVLDEAAAARLQERLREDRSQPPRRSEAFLQLLYGAGSLAEIRSRLVTVDFLGFPVQVHEMAAGALREVAADCASARTTNPDVDAFIKGLSEIDGFNYRDVAGTHALSYHGYGLALDMIPRSYAGKATYWRWVMERDPRWWETPYAERWGVPQAIVDAFERHGFVWGGKWLFFDTMHFEYRPEILLLSRNGS